MLLPHNSNVHFIFDIVPMALMRRQTPNRIYGGAWREASAILFLGIGGQAGAEETRPDAGGIAASLFASSAALIYKDSADCMTFIEMICDIEVKSSPHRRVLQRKFGVDDNDLL